MLRGVEEIVKGADAKEVDRFMSYAMLLGWMMANLEVGPSTA